MYAKTWYDFIRQSRKKFECSKLANANLNELSPRAVARSVYIDFLNVVKAGKKISAEIKLYGDIIQKVYGVSRLRQAVHQAYLTLKIGVKLKHYRAYLLFIDDRWKYVDRFTYENYPVQMALVNKTFPEEKAIFDNKLKFYNHCLKKNVPTPPIILIFENGKQIIQKKSSACIPRKSIFIKDLFGRRGQGAAKYTFSHGKYIDVEGTTFDEKALINKIAKDSSKRKIIVQPACKNHKKWHGFTSGALATCRVLTARRRHSNHIIPISATLRMPVGNSDTDNTTTGGIASALNLKNGKLNVAIRKKPYNGNFQLNCHPDTEKRIGGTILPCWEQLLQVAINAHKTCKTAFIGWDIAYTKEGFKVIEGNIGWSVRVVESPQRRPLAETAFSTIFDEWMNT